MNINRTRQFRVDMGDYESYQFGASVTLGHGDLGYTDEDLVEMSDDERKELQKELTRKILKVLDEQLIQEIKDSAELTENKKSFLLRSFTTAASTSTSTSKKKRKRK